MTNFKFQKLLLSLSVIVFVAVGCARFSQPPAQPAAQIQRQQAQVSQQVEGVDASEQALNFYVDENRSALDLLKSNHQIETKTFSGIGEYVASINGKKEDAGKNFWALYVNGAQSQVGASDYKPAGGDKIVWKLEEIKN